MMTILCVCAALALCAGQWMIWFYAPVESSMGLVQKIFYMHLPMAWWSMVSFFVVFAGSVGYLVRRSPAWDRLAGAGAEIGVLMSALALATGTLWAKPAWNVWWTWDPRLTTTLVMWFVYAAYLMLRTSNPGREKRALSCAVLGVVAFLDVPLVFFSARMWRSVHPAVLASRGGGLEPEMLATMLFNLGAFGLLWLAILIIRIRQMSQSERLDALVVWEENE